VAVRIVHLKHSALDYGIVRVGEIPKCTGDEVLDSGHGTRLPNETGANARRVAIIKLERSESRRATVTAATLDL